ncbi:hypothetical protein N9N03_01455 [Chlamydiia bacterium]|nr:hypothetical protein [Chlamydiia bacterium]
MKKFATIAYTSLLCMLGVITYTFFEEPNSEHSLPLENIVDTRVNIDFTEGEMHLFVDLVAAATNKTFVYEKSDLMFPINFNTSIGGIQVKSLVSLMYHILQANNLLIAQEGNNYFVYKSTDPDNKRLSVPEIVEPGKADSQNSATTPVTRIYKYKYLQSTDAIRIINKISSPYSLIDIHPSTNMLIISDYAQNVNRAIELLETIDIPSEEISWYTYQPKHVDATTIKSLASKLITPFIKEESSWQIFYNESVGSLIIFSSKDLIQKTIEIFNIIDVQTNENKDLLSFTKNSVVEKEFYLYRVQNQNGAELVETLKNVVGSSDADQAVTSKLIGTLSSMQFVESTNSIMMTGDPSSLMRVDVILKSLDIPVNQVLIEVLAIDCDIDNSFEFGLNWGYQYDHATKDRGLQISNYSPLSNQGTFNDKKTNLLDQLPDNSFSIGVIGSHISHAGKIIHTLGGLAKSVQGTKKGNIVLNQKMVIEENKNGTFFVGRNTRLTKGVSQSNTNTGVTASEYEFRNIGSNFSITPRVSGDLNTITLAIQYEKSQNAPESESNNVGVAVPVSNTSISNTQAHLNNGEYLLISGMTEKEITKRDSNIPCLGGLPLVGMLFSNKNHTDLHRNLMVFIRATLVENNRHHEINMNQANQLSYYGIDTPEELNPVIHTTRNSDTLEDNKQ